MSLPLTLSAAACQVLCTASSADKVALSAQFANAWRDGAIIEIGDTTPPHRPARPERPQLLHPSDMPRRRKGGAAGRLAFLHAIAHIELNAIDLAWDIVCRFPDEAMPREFFDDWVNVAADEARHFDLLAKRMDDLGGAYGELPAHDGLWEAAEQTTDDLMARLALVPMVLEARGLDITPGAIEKLRANGDIKSADILKTISDEEVPHVAAGVRWLTFLAKQRGIERVAAFHEIVRSRFKGQIKPPFNHAARDKAGMDRAFYETTTPAP